MKRFPWNKGFIYRTALFFYPFLWVFVLGFFLIPYTLEYLKEAIAFGCMTVLLYALVLIITKRLRTGVYFLFTILLSLLALVKLGFYYLYSVKPSASALFVIFETNSNETMEYLGEYFSVPLIVMAIGLMLPVLFSIVAYMKAPKGILFGNLSSIGMVGKLGLLAIVFMCGFVIQWKFSQENLMLKTYYSYQDYQQFKGLMEENLAKPNTYYFQELNAFASEEETIIVVIGESTSRWHMELYGYPRETNPKLKEIEGELLVFEDVISPHVHTIMSLEKILTFADFEDQKPDANASVIQMANEAGYETFWISNQQPIGAFESLSTVIASAAKHTYFVATEGYQYTIHDENLLPVISKALQHPSKRKVVFVHLIGTHVAYRKRYPKEFDVFNGVVAPNKNDKINEYINNYDNAIRYNDSIVREIIESIRPLPGKKSMVYFSDHGDDVYDVGNKLGHNEFLPTPPMYEVPFLLWLTNDHPVYSNLWKHKDTLVKRPYHLENFPYAFASLIGVTFKQNDSTRSLFSKAYKPRTRIVRDSINYDEK